MNRKIPFSLGKRTNVLENFVRHNKEDKYTLGVLSLISTFLDNYQDDGKGKIPKHAKKILNRCSNGMRKAFSLDPKGYTECISDIDKIYNNAIEYFKNEKVVLDVMDTASKLYDLDRDRLTKIYYLDQKLVSDMDNKKGIVMDDRDISAQKVVKYLGEELRKTYGVEERHNKELRAIVIKIKERAKNH